MNLKVIYIVLCSLGLSAGLQAKTGLALDLEVKPSSMFYTDDSSAAINILNWSSFYFQSQLHGVIDFENKLFFDFDLAYTHFQKQNYALNIGYNTDIIWMSIGPSIALTFPNTTALIDTRLLFGFQASIFIGPPEIIQIYTKASVRSSVLFRNATRGDITQLNLQGGILIPGRNIAFFLGANFKSNDKTNIYTDLWGLVGSELIGFAANNPFRIRLGAGLIILNKRFSDNKEFRLTGIYLRLSFDGILPVRNFDLSAGISIYPFFFETASDLADIMGIPLDFSISLHYFLPKRSLYAPELIQRILS